MGVELYHIPVESYRALRPTVRKHDNEIVGPRSRGYWFERPNHYDYAGVQVVAQRLHDAGEAYGLKRLEITEPEAQGLALLEIEFADDGASFPPALLLTSGEPAALTKHLDIMREEIGSTPAEWHAHLVVADSDPRFIGYFKKHLNHIRDVLPRLWAFYQEAITEGHAIVVIDLRALKIEIPEPSTEDQLLMP